MVPFSPTPPPSAQGHPVLPVPMARQPRSKSGAREWERRSLLVMVQIVYPQSWEKEGWEKWRKGGGQQKQMEDRRGDGARVE